MVSRCGPPFKWGECRLVCRLYTWDGVYEYGEDPAEVMRGYEEAAVSAGLAAKVSEATGTGIVAAVNRGTAAALGRSNRSPVGDSRAVAELKGCARAGEHEGGGRAGGQEGRRPGRITGRAGEEVCGGAVGEVSGVRCPSSPAGASFHPIFLMLECW